MTRPKVLVLAGTTEARRLADAMAEAGVAGIVSFAGRVERPAPHALPSRTGGFGGPDGLAAHIRAEGITHVVDATHPFAAQMSCNAVAAARAAGIPLIALTRPAWEPGPGDDWTRVPDVAAAAAWLDRPRMRVMLAVGRMHLPEFAANPQHAYLLRLVDPAPVPFPDAEAVIERGPFTEADDRALMERHSIQLVVSKNAGGTGARAKLDAARALGLPILMIDRPALPEREEARGPREVLDWIHENRGV